MLHVNVGYNVVLDGGDVVSAADRSKFSVVGDAVGMESLENGDVVKVFR